MHIWFAIVTFAAILFFMWHHCNRSVAVAVANTSPNYLYDMFSIQVAGTGALAVDYVMCKQWLIYIETFLLANFAVYYMYLHYLQFESTADQPLPLPLPLPHPQPFEEKKE